MRKLSNAEEFVSLRDFLERSRPVPVRPMADRKISPFPIKPKAVLLGETDSDALEHEFNNLMQVVKSAFNIIGRRPEMSGCGDLTFVMRSAQQAADKAASLGRSLLTQPPAHAPDQAGLNDLLLRLSNVLASLAGDGSDLGLTLSEGLPLPDCDPLQLETAIINLAMSVLGGMPDGGSMRIETCLAELTFPHFGLLKGHYVALGFTGTPHSLSRDRLRAANGVGGGAGNGLRLLSVKSFAERYGGCLDISGGANQDIAIRLYLPCRPRN